MTDAETVDRYFELKLKAQEMSYNLSTTRNSRGKLMFVVAGGKKMFYHSDINVIFGYLQGVWEAAK